MIGDDIEIVVIKIKGGQTALGIKAPDDLPVHREEIYRRVQEEKARADD
jgi:carbon storage regulator